MKLTEKQKRFAEEYIKLGNATQAYIDAGYSVTKREVAEANARKLLGNNSVIEYIKELNDALKSAQIADMGVVLKPNFFCICPVYVSGTSQTYNLG